MDISLPPGCRRPEMDSARGSWAREAQRQAKESLSSTPISAAGKQDRERNTAHGPILSRCALSVTFGCAIGPQIGFIFPVGDMQGYLNFKAYKEFAAESRPEGWNAWVTFVISPAAPTPTAPPKRIITSNLPSPRWQSLWASECVLFSRATADGRSAGSRHFSSKKV
jgi:hypothetical protein